MTRFAVAVLVLALLVCSLAVWAQDLTPKVQVFGGYSFLHADTNGVNGPALDTIFGAAPGTFDVKTSYNGWNAEAQYNANRWLGMAADFSGNYGTPLNVSALSGITGLGITGLPGARSYSFLFGPVLSYRTSKFTPFVHALFGANRVSTDNVSVLAFALPSTSFSDTAFAMALGGGADVNLNSRFAVRLAQVDYLYTRHDLNALANSIIGTGLITGLPDHQNNLRVSAGVVFRF